MLSAIKVGPSSIKTGFRDQLAELKSDAYKQEGMASDQTGKKEYPSQSRPCSMPEYGVDRSSYHWRDWRSIRYEEDKVTWARAGSRRSNRL